MSETPAAIEQLKSGVRRAGGWLLGCAWFGLVIWGITNTFGTEAYFQEGHHPSRVLGYGILAVAGTIFAATANRWKRVFPGIMPAGGWPSFFPGFRLGCPILPVFWEGWGFRPRI